MRFFLDGHSRIYVDDDESCDKLHHGHGCMFHQRLILPAKKRMFTETIRCPRSLSPQERSKLKEKYEAIAEGATTLGLGAKK